MNNQDTATRVILEVELYFGFNLPRYLKAKIRRIIRESKKDKSKGCINIRQDYA